MLNIFLFFLSFLVVALGQPALCPWLGPFAASLGIALHWKSLEKFSSIRKSILLSFFWFFGVQCIQLSWMTHIEYQGIYILFLYVVLSIAMALQFAFLTKIVFKRGIANQIDICLIPCLWVLFEWARLFISCGFAFNFLGVSLSGCLFSLQTASLFGVLGMSFWAVMSNVVALKMFQKFSWACFGLWLGICAAPYLYGWVRIVYYEQSQSLEKKQQWSALLVQTALSPPQKVPLRGRELEFVPPLQQWDRIFGLIGEDKAFDLLALPEAAVPFGLDQYIYRIEEADQLLEKHFGKEASSWRPQLQAPFCQGRRVSNAYFLQALSNRFQASVFAGLDYQSEKGEFYNSVFYFAPTGVPLQRYDKKILLPMAEYMPFSCLEKLSAYYGVEEFFTPGTRPPILGGSLRVAPSICYEELFSWGAREGRRLGADVLVNFSNDGWYPFSSLPQQHFSQGLVRAVENGIPLLRSCNTGVTAAVDCFGRVIAKWQDEKGEMENVPGALLVKVPQTRHPTVFSIYGDLPLIVFAFFLVFFVWIKDLWQEWIVFPLSSIGNRS